MPSISHDALVDLFVRRLALATDVLHRVLGVSIPEHTTQRREDKDLSQLLPTEYRADHVVVLERDGAPVLAIVVEVQLHRSEDKRWAWPAYLAVLRGRLRCDVLLLVVTTSRTVARWAARPIPLGHPTFILTPLVVGPAGLAGTLEPVGAVAEPELAVLWLMSCGRELSVDAAVRAAMAAIDAARALDEERARVYLDLILMALRAEARAAVEAHMSSKYEYQSDFARKYYGQGKAEGKAVGIAEGRAVGIAEGKAEGKAEALLMLLGHRGLTITSAQRERVLRESSGATLDGWIARAVTAASVRDVLGDTGDDAS